ncbi:DUF947-domain-containing protein [Chiua virens]|nr:DUF947-domain-containing protein [Chiua virens]
MTTNSSYMTTPDSNDDASPSPGSDSEDADADDDRTRQAGPSSRRLRSLEDDLSTLPLGTLRTAQRALAQAHALSDTESAPEQQRPSKPKTDIAKRANKHAPVEITSKRPVSRRRIVVDDKLPKPRDPRFMHAAGRYDPTKFRQRYDFLADFRKDELSTLREHTKRARKLITNSPSHLREEREGEIQRLERATKRAESAVNLDNRERVELEAVRSAKRTEKEKGRQGKAEWWMKRSAKKELLAKARLDAIASVGGKQAVKKALEKKQKKISQKEKKMRPILRNVEGVELSNGKRRRPVGLVDLGGVKRRKVV